MISNYLVAPILAWAIAQFIKFSTVTLKTQQVDVRWLWKSGGLPSSHSAIVSALATTVYVLEGATSSSFALALILTVIVLYDAVGVRRAAGMNSQAIINLQQKVGTKLPDKFKIVLGHRPIEMISGLALGIIVGLASTYTAWAEKVDSVKVTVSGVELLAAFMISIILLVVALTAMSRLKRKAVKKLPTTSKIRSWTIGGLLTPSILMLIFSAAASQEISPLGWRIWVWATFAYIVGVQIFLSFAYYRHLPERLKTEQKIQKTSSRRGKIARRNRAKTRKSKKRK